MNYVKSNNDAGFQDPEQWFHTLASHYVEAQIYFHLNQCEVFEALRQKGVCSRAELAKGLGLDEHVLTTLVNYVVSVGDVIAKTDDDGIMLTPFGLAVLERYGRTTAGRRQYNIFDVRIGSWGPVWENLTGMLRGDKRYGRDLCRNGNAAAEGVYKIAAPLAPAVEQAARSIGAKSIVEIGPTSGVLGVLAGHDPSLTCIGVDVKPQSLVEARGRAEAAGVTSVVWKEGDLFRVGEWIDQLPGDGPVLFFSFHIHEFLQHGTPAVIEALRTITSWPKTGAVLAVEQPQLEEHERDTVPTIQWGYSQSHVLIHHLIKNAQILTTEGWSQLLLDGGCASVEQSASPCFGFKAFMGRVEHKG